MEVKELVNRKNILLVGNGSGIKNKGELIDSYEFVIRFNYGISQTKQSNIGKKCDAWVCSMKSKGACVGTYKKAIIKPKYTVRFWGEYNDELDQQIENSIYLPRMSIYYKLKNKLSLNEAQNPSTGISFLDYLIEECNTESITLIGFDSFKTPNFYSSSIHAGLWHDGKKEAEYIKELVSKEKVKII